MRWRLGNTDACNRAASRRPEAPAGVVKTLSPWIEANAVVPLYIGCLTLPAVVVANTQDGIARA